MKIMIIACPVCGGITCRRDDGTLVPHERYADGAGYGPTQSHELVDCEGGGKQP
jgi:hypothetical protein